MSMAKTERGWRGTPDLWLDAAYALLVESGIEAVKVMPLADRLGLSRTSFYWHFADREALLAGLVARWQAKNTGNLIARCEAPAATMAEADATRLAAITALFRRFGYSEAEADTRARTLYLTQVGYIALRSEESLEVRMGRNPAYVLTFCGTAPTGAEIAAFQARHEVRLAARATPAASQPLTLSEARQCPPKSARRCPCAR